VGDCEAPCKLSCPAQMDIPKMNRLIAEKKFEEAIKLIKEDIALPYILGYICSAPCEGACKRKPIDEAVSICQLKKFVAQTDLISSKAYFPKKQKAKGEKIAIIGAGPTGLSASFFLTKAGYDVVVFDKNEKAGGSLDQTVKDTILPQQALEAELRFLSEYGIEFKLNHHIDQKILLNFQEHMGRF
jgi:NADPH-dependent glutamate synthase beta subunit-like oxidoreductase